MFLMNPRMGGGRGSGGAASHIHTFPDLVTPPGVSLNLNQHVYYSKYLHQSFFPGGGKPN